MFIESLLLALTSIILLWIDGKLLCRDHSPSSYIKLYLYSVVIIYISGVYLKSGSEFFNKDLIGGSINEEIFSGKATF